MKRNFLDSINYGIDRTIGIFSPSAELNRQRDRLIAKQIRGYDAAGGGFNNPFARKRPTTAAVEVSKSFESLAAAGQELCRNNPLAHRIKTQWASNVVGNGITLDVQAAKSVKKSLMSDWEEWANSTNCDFDGQYPLSGLEWIWVAAIVESGGVIIRRHTNAAMKIPLQLQTIEHTHLSRVKDGQYKDYNVVNGIKFNKHGQREGCYVKIVDINLPDTGVEPHYYEFGKDIVYLYRKERPNQHIGVSWLSNIATTLDKYKDTQDAKLTQLQIAACLALIVKDAEQSFGLNLGKEGNSQDPTYTIGHEIGQGTVEYVGSGTEVETITPPNPSESSAFMYDLKTEIAAGVDLTHAQLTGDYSKFNFASGRMSKLDFYMMLEFVQINIMKPNLNQIYNWFADARDMKTSKFSTSKRPLPMWTFPARSAVNPLEEFEVLFKKCRAGIISPKKMASMLGEKLEESIAGWKESKELWGDLVFDLDPEKYSPVGNQLDDNDAASSNNGQSGKTDVSEPGLNNE